MGSDDAFLFDRERPRRMILRADSLTRQMLLEFHALEAAEDAATWDNLQNYYYVRSYTNQHVARRGLDVDWFRR